MKNWKIGWRLGAGFGLVAVMMVVIVAMSYVQLKSMAGTMEGIVKFRVDRLRQANDLIDLVNKRAISFRDVVVITDDAALKMESAYYKSLLDQFQTTYDQILNDPRTDDEGRRSLGQIADAARQVLQEENPAYALAMQNTDESNKKALDLMLNKVKPLQLQLIASVNSFIELQKQKMNADYEGAVHAYQTAVAMMVGIAIVALVLSGLAGWIITQSVVKPVNDAVKLAEAVAAGDLTHQITSDRQDETGKLINALAQMNQGLVTIVSHIRTSVETINTAAEEIAAGNTDLSQRTEEQAASLEETAASMEELTATVKANAHNAVQASNLAGGASDVATRGGAVMGEVVDTMASISDSSKKIVDIISVIDGIAFQTNILALNAAVEAARAGEQGRGFAVVASEVRTLAQRSAAAAKEIKTLINDSVEKVHSGTQLVDRAGSTMKDVVESISSVTQIMADISHASNEQSAGIEQVGAAVTQMDEVTQQNAALVEEAAASASSMQDQARVLMEAVSQFKLGTGDAAFGSTLGRSTHRAAPKKSSSTKPRIGQKPSGHAVPAKSPEHGDDWQEF